MNTPRKTRLYNEIAKDYMPKQAEMMICQYIEGLETRILSLETLAAEQAKSKKTAETKAAAKAEE